MVREMDRQKILEEYSKIIFNFSRHGNRSKLVMDLHWWKRKNNVPKDLIVINYKSLFRGK